MADTFKEVTELARSGQEFFNKLLENGLKIYRRGKKTFGVYDQETKKNYRLSTLGVLGDFMTGWGRWKETEKQKKEFEEMLSQKGERKWKEHGVAEAVDLVLSDRSDMTKEEREFMEIQRRKLQRKQEKTRNKDR